MSMETVLRTWFGPTSSMVKLSFGMSYEPLEEPTQHLGAEYSADTEVEGITVDA
jgi:hypothetical protein